MPFGKVNVIMVPCWFAIVVLRRKGLELAHLGLKLESLRKSVNLDQRYGVTGSPAG